MPMHQEQIQDLNFFNHYLHLVFAYALISLAEMELVEGMKESIEELIEKMGELIEEMEELIEKMEALIE
jgi:predicted nuclease with TOPRIM domain